MALRDQARWLPWVRHKARKHDAAGVAQGQESRAGDFRASFARLEPSTQARQCSTAKSLPSTPDGKPSFQLLQNRKSAAGTIVYYAFDLLSLEGEDWRSRPIEERKAKLAEIVEGSEVRFSASFEGPRQSGRGRGEDGTGGSRREATGSVYQAGERSGDWLKYKLSPEQEFVVGGYKRGSPLESLVVGYYENGKLMCAGKVRQGLTRAEPAGTACAVQTDC